MSCGCYCAALHPQKEICDVEAPEAIVSIDSDGSALAEFEPWARDVPILMCQPCADAVVAAHPRAKTMVALPKEDET